MGVCPDICAFSDLTRIERPSARIGRIVTSPRDRKAGLGRWLVRQALDFVAARYGDVTIKIAAQAYLEQFYAEFGFMRSSPDYLEDGILHCDMLRQK